MHLVHLGCGEVSHFHKQQAEAREHSWQTGTGIQAQIRDKYLLHNQAVTPEAPTAEEDRA